MRKFLSYPAFHMFFARDVGLGDKPCIVWFFGNVERSPEKGEAQGRNAFGHFNKVVAGGECKCPMEGPSGGFVGEVGARSIVHIVTPWKAC